LLISDASFGQFVHLLQEHPKLQVAFDSWLAGNTLGTVTNHFIGLRRIKLQGLSIAFVNLGVISECAE
jgi:hypothetical protein